MSLPIRGFLLGLAGGAVLGGLGVYTILRNATQVFEIRAETAVAASAALRQQHDSIVGVADSLRRQADAVAPSPEAVAGTVERLVEVLPPELGDSLRSLMAALDQERHLRRQEADTRQRADTVILRAVDTVTTTLESRPTAAVTWSWRPKINGLAFADVALSGQACAGVGPTLSLWRIRLLGYGSLCTGQYRAISLDPSQSLAIPTVEGRIGVRGEFRF